MSVPSTVPAVIDGLLEKITELDYTFNGKPLAVHVSDGFPGPFQAPVLVMFGGVADLANEGETEWAGIGGNVIMYEHYELLASVLTTTGGTSDTGVDPTSADAASDAQRLVRNWAFSVVAQITQAVLDDMLFTNISGGHPDGLLWVQPTYRTRLLQTQKEDASKGRNVILDFSFHALGRIGGF